MRKSDLWLLTMAAALALLMMSFVDTWIRQSTAEASLSENRLLVSQLGLTDPALFTEARYTRHLSLADRHSAFQDHPAALEHFPSGALVPPPKAIR